MTDSLAKRKKRKLLIAGGVLGILGAALYFSVQLPEPQVKLEVLRGQVRRALELSPDFAGHGPREVFALYAWSEDHVAVKDRVQQEVLAQGFKFDSIDPKNQFWKWTKSDLTVYIQAEQLADLKDMKVKNRNGVSVVVGQRFQQGNWLRWRDMACDLLCNED